MSLISDAIAKAYPTAVLAHEGAPFVRPDWTHDVRSYSSGFYWENLDGDRFYFPTFAEAAEDLATDIGMDAVEALAIVAGCDHA